MKGSYLIFLLFLCSCSGIKIKNKIQEPELDLLKSETFDRYSKDRIVGHQIKSPLHQGILLCYKKQFKKGQEHFKNILDKYSNSPHYWNNIAICHKLQNENQKAMFYLNLAIGHAKKSRDKAIINNNIGVMLLGFNKDFEAQKQFQTSIKQSKTLLTPKLNLARLYLQYGLYTKALKELHYLHVKNNNDIDVNALLGKAYLLQGNSKRGHFYLTKIPKSYFKRHDLANVLAATLTQLGQFKNAKKVLDNIESSNMNKLSLATKDLYNYIENR
jgi:Flp pilus assembly protein TadD